MIYQDRFALCVVSCRTVRYRNRTEPGTGGNLISVILNGRQSKSITDYQCFVERYRDFLAGTGTVPGTEYNFLEGFMNIITLVNSKVEFGAGYAALMIRSTECNKTRSASPPPHPRPF
jgi:hypothetical protein